MEGVALVLGIVRAPPRERIEAAGTATSSRKAREVVAAFLVVLAILSFVLAVRLWAFLLWGGLQ
jgi:hypothetical protein